MQQLVCALRVSPVFAGVAGGFRWQAPLAGNRHTRDAAAGREKANCGCCCGCCCIVCGCGSGCCCRLHRLRLPLLLQLLLQLLPQLQCVLVVNALAGRDRLLRQLQQLQFVLVVIALAAVVPYAAIRRRASKRAQQTACADLEVPCSADSLAWCLQKKRPVSCRVWLQWQRPRLMPDPHSQGSHFLHLPFFAAPQSQKLDLWHARQSRARLERPPSARCLQVCWACVSNGVGERGHCGGWYRPMQCCNAPAIAAALGSRRGCCACQPRRRAG